MTKRSKPARYYDKKKQPLRTFLRDENGDIIVCPKCESWDVIPHATMNTAYCKKCHTEWEIQQCA